MRRAFVWGLVALGAFALAGSSAAGSESATAANQEILVTYKGRLDTQWEPVMKEPDGRNFHVARYQWSLTWGGRVNQLASNPNVSLKVGTLKGSVTYVDKTSAENADCSGTFVAKVKKIPMTASYDQGSGVITFMPRFPVSTEFLRATNTTSIHEFCGEIVWWRLPDRYRLPVFQLKVKQKGDSRSNNRAGAPSGRNREKSVITQTLSLKITSA